MLVPKKVKFRKWQSGRRSQVRREHKETRGISMSFGSFGLKAESPARIKSNQIEAARRVISRQVGKFGKVWIRVFPDRPITQKGAEVPMGKGKGDPYAYCVEIFPGRILFEVDGVTPEIAREALRKAGSKLPVKTRIIART